MFVIRSPFGSNSFVRWSINSIVYIWKRHTLAMSGVCAGRSKIHAVLMSLVNDEKGFRSILKRFDMAAIRGVRIAAFGSITLSISDIDIVVDTFRENVPWGLRPSHVQDNVTEHCNFPDIHVPEEEVGDRASLKHAFCYFKWGAKDAQIPLQIYVQDLRTLEPVCVEIFLNPTNLFA